MNIFDDKELTHSTEARLIALWLWPLGSRFKGIECDAPKEEKKVSKKSPIVVKLRSVPQDLKLFLTLQWGSPTAFHFCTHRTEALTSTITFLVNKRVRSEKDVRLRGRNNLN